MQMGERLNKNACSTIDLYAGRSRQMGIKMRINAEDTMVLVIDLQEKLVPVIECGYDIIENTITVK
jgi:hypothetical protein